MAQGEPNMGALKTAHIGGVICEEAIMGQHHEHTIDLSGNSGYCYPNKSTNSPSPVGISQKKPFRIERPLAYTETKKRPFSCLHCEATFTDKITQRAHQKTHRAEKAFHCPHCSKGFDHEITLQMHQQVHTTVNPLTATDPGKKLLAEAARKAKEKLEKNKTLPGEKRYSCTQCEKTFNLEVDLDTHQRMHILEIVFICVECGKSFTQRAYLRKHQKIHTGEKPYVCEMCGRAFNRQEVLVAHQTTHSGDKPYKCSKCDKRFSRKYTLRKHLRLHIGEKSFHCVKCDNTFSQETDLERHIQTHAVEEPNKCF
ncbi:zinc finger protein OZF-like [Pleurodeles waltl]